MNTDFRIVHLQQRTSVEWFSHNSVKEFGMADTSRSGERGLPSESIEERTTQRPNVDSMVIPRTDDSPAAPMRPIEILSAEYVIFDKLRIYLGSAVRESAGKGPQVCFVVVPCFRQTKICKLDCEGLLGLYQNIRGLDISMHYQVSMQIIKRI